MKNITILGVSGSIGGSTLAVIDINHDKFRVFAVSANTNWQKMLNLCEKYNPYYAVMVDGNAASKLEKNLKNGTKVLSGVEALCFIATHKQTDYVMAAITGVAGVFSVIAAANSGKRIMLANKESLILAGDILINAAITTGAEIIPVDSEHNAIFQCLKSGVAGLHKVQLTASGGPFLHTPLSQLINVTPFEACRHPNWDMGNKISIDSATMMNKGLEVIEAYYLFALNPSQIEVIVHPQSIVHSLVHYKDGAVLAQLGIPDMRSAIAYALAYPKRLSSGVEFLDLTSMPALEFYKPDLAKFSCLRLAFEALKKGGSVIGVLNAANEVAVAAFCERRIKFLDIAKVIEMTLEKSSFSKIDSFDIAIANDKQARRIALEAVHCYDL